MKRAKIAEVAKSVANVPQALLLVHRAIYNIHKSAEIINNSANLIQLYGIPTLLHFSYRGGQVSLYFQTPQVKSTQTPEVL